MKSDTIIVSNTGSRMDEALNQAELVGAYKHLSDKSILHLRLLTEEMMGMMRSITGEQSGKFWIEDDGDTYKLHLLVDTRMNTAKREHLLAASTSGKNESAKGFMGRVMDFFDRNADEDVVAFSSPLLMSGAYENGQDILHDVEWSMLKYRQDVYDNKDDGNSAALAAWDELEKSVVAHVADEVKVRIRGQQAELIIYKKFS
jgi:hypothetical protein